MEQKKLTYKETGISYTSMDPLKQKAQVAGKQTARNLLKSNMKELPQSRGESAYVVEHGNSYLAIVEECLGTKTLVADAMRQVTGKTYYDQLAQDTVAMMVNDLITVGAKPSVIMAYWAMGSAARFEDKEMISDLIDGWKKACDQAGAVWGGGESPTLAGLLEKNAVDLAGACFGIIKPKKRITLGNKLKAGDRILLFESSGIHANGISLARKLAEKLPKGYATKMKDGRMYGEALLDPTLIYANVIEQIFSAGIDIHYSANITGHGWRKVMRYHAPFTYRITTIPPVPEVLQFMVEKGPIDSKEAYGNLNMGAGYALFIEKKDVEKVKKIAKKNKIKIYDAGEVQKGKKQVVIEPLHITFEGESLQLRG